MNATTLQQSAKPGILHAQWSLLRLTFGIVPIVAGADKFFNILTDWSQYLNPSLAAILPFSADTFMMIVGVIEILAGIIVLVKTELGAYIVAAWPLCISLSLIVSLSYLDVAVRDAVMAVGAFTLARLTKLKGQ
jgi:uncharacterized membrane protein YphA (DoxX/SURF4 family)